MGRAKQITRTFKRFYGTFESEAKFRAACEKKGYHILEIKYGPVVNGMAEFSAWMIYIRNLPRELQESAKNYKLPPAGDVIRVPKLVDRFSKVK